MLGAPSGFRWWKQPLCQGDFGGSAVLVLRRCWWLGGGSNPFASDDFGGFGSAGGFGGGSKTPLLVVVSVASVARWCSSLRELPIKKLSHRRGARHCALHVFFGLE
ncbi:hypothetical protein F7734_07285 [Scytonema sp. UIC 10036]|uniref:hypothetical protein n=1 Tax=Scytonema sp. UIC 10036 TaxID=2304196 RepID=UPI0012DA17AE|nr:hypothetical protein [Scytonema sp. UIC 10036]MUG92269.1 hypothetical protein [Scytonema sp. UIC 10036]